MRRIAAQYLFTGREFIRNGYVEIDRSGRVAGLGSLGDMPVEIAGTEFFNGILTPAFVNAHCHVELSHVKDMIPRHSGMTDFCRTIMSLKHCRERQLEAMYEADREMFDEGIIAVGDISNGDASLQMKKDSRLTYHTFIETLDLDPCLAEEKIVRARHIKRSFEQAGLRASIVPHAPYSLSDELFETSVAEGNSSRILSIHNQESREEIELFVTKQGRMRDFFGQHLDAFIHRYDNPLLRIMQYVDPDTNLMLVHNTRTREADVALAVAGNRRTTWVICPASNLYIEDCLPDVNMLCRCNARIATGTDSLSSNSRLSILQELKILDSAFPEAGLVNILRWATLNGAEALMLDAEIGSFDTGKRPGVLLISDVDFENMHLTDNCKVKRLF